MKHLTKYPLIDYLEKRAAQRIPHVALTYLNCGTGDDKAVQRNCEGLEEVYIQPQFMKGLLNVDTLTTLFGQKYNAPFGTAPIGLTGLMWPRAENILAKTAKKYGIPSTLSTVATETPEDIGPLIGNMGWFQLYPPRDKSLRSDLLKRARENGFHTMVLTVDIPTPSRREKSIKAGLTMPPKISAKFLYQAITHPAWTKATLSRGLPKLRTMLKYVPSGDTRNLVQFVGQNLGGTLDWEYVKEVRDLWDGPLILKGILHPDDAKKSIAIGVDGIGVSNHGGRQFNGVESGIASLKDIVPVVEGKAKIIYDGGIRSGLDVLKALVIGADFVLVGRPFIWGVAALGEEGGDHVAQLLLDDLTNNMMQVGCQSIQEVKQLSYK